MKKILIALAIVAVFLVAGSYFFIPKNLKIATVLTYQTNGNGLFRFLTKEDNWKKWWPGSVSDSQNEKKVFTYSGYEMRIEKILYHAFELNFTKDNQPITGILKVVALGTDSAQLEIDTEMDAGTNPVKRILNYFQARKIKTLFDNMLLAIKTHTDSVKELYDFEIVSEKVQMQHLLSASKTFSHYPTTEEIYSLVDFVRGYINKTDGKEEFSPMLNIETSDSISYLVRVGLPVNKQLPETKDITAKQMVKNGNILATEVTGDLKAINEAMQQFEKFISDNQRSIIAIPFQSLITDRRKDPDSTKWVTKIYYPVI